PNAGKSSIFNHIVGSERAIVDKKAGTTRDFIEKKIQLGCININLIDTAGIRNTEENIEKKGISKTIELQRVADLVLLVFDCSLPFPEYLDTNLEHLIVNENVIIVLNKSDLGNNIQFSNIKFEENVKIKTSIKEIESLSLLQKAIEENLVGESKAYTELSLFVNLRQSHALENASHSLEECILNLSKESIELSIPELKDSIKYLGEIVGDTDNEDMLDVLFSNFCIGK
ncbi:MAG: GTPase, partial [Verrucomicrobiota bacterium]|nr:GTPase [Verrucomicrobiota bacterium]